MSRPGPAFVVSRRSLSLAPVLLVGLTVLSCLGEITGPDGGIRPAVFALAPNFPPAFAVEGSGGVVPFTRVRVTADFGTENLATVVRDFPADQRAIELSLRIGLPAGTTSAGIDLTLNMQYINAAGDTVFRAGPQVVRVVPDEGRAPVPIVPLDVAYVGTGANAAFVAISPQGASVMAGTTTTFSATAFDVNESVITGTPFVFSSPDLTRVTVTPQGLATWLPVRGAARVIATLPTGAIADTTTFTVTLPPVQLEVVRGNGQGGLAGAALASPVVLRVTAADAVPVEGVTVTFALPTGGGSVTPATAISDVDGLVSFAWTLGAADGVQTATATFPGLVTPLTLTAVANPSTAGGLVVWTGAVDFDWSVAGNWSTGVVPSASDSVVIPAVATQPRLTAETTVGAVNVSAGTLWLNGHGLAVTRNFATTGSGVLVMQEEGSGLSVVGDALFAGGNESGLLTLGGLGVLGNFTQTGANSTASFQAGPDFVVTLSANSPTVSFQNPGAGANDSRFGNLSWSGSGTLTQQSDVTVSGAYIISTSTAATQLGVGDALGRNLEFASFVSTGALTFDNVRVVVAQPADAPQTVQLNSVTFRNLPGSATQLTVNAPGGVINLDNVVFQSTPTTGLYIAATDINGADGDPLVVEVANATPTTPGGFTSVGGGAVINWPPGAGVRLWTGTTDAAWTNAANWSGAIVPTTTDSVHIPAGTPNAPLVDIASEIRTLTLAPAASLILGSQLTVHGSVDVAPTAAITSSGGRLDLSSATGGTISGALPQVVVNGGLFTLDGDVSINGNLEIYGNEFTPGVPVEGDVSIGNFTLTSTGGMFVGAQGTFTMMGTGVADFATYVNFWGNSTAGKLTNGTLRVGTELMQDGTDSPSSFQASGAHAVEFAGASPQPRIFFSSPDASANAGCTASCFATLRSVKAPGQGGLRFQSDAKILGALQLQADSVSAPGFQIIAAGAPTFDTPILRAGGIGFQGALTQNASTLAVDSLVAWGVGGPLSGIAGVRTVVTGSYTLDNVAYPAPLEVDGALSIANNVAISGNLVVDGTVALSAVDAPALLTISGSLTVRGPASALISSGQPHVIDVTGNATFAGPNSTGNLVTGRLRVGSNFSAQATVSPLSFVADPAYVVEFTGTGTISVSDPAQSTFGSVEFTNSGFSRTLNTDIRATGVVSLLASSFTLASGAGAGAGNTRRIFADRVDAPAPGVSMFNVGLSARSFESGLNGSINFNNFDPSVVQLDLLEGGLQNSTLRNATFSTVPTGAGRYVRIVDATPTGGDGSPTLVVESPTPLFHGGWAEAVAPAIMTGWGRAPDFRWTGDASSTWMDPGNWADTIVPSSADSVYLTDGYLNPPQFPASMTLRALVSDVTSPLNLTGTVTVTERLVLPSVVTCDGGTIVLAGGVNPVLFSGDISCGLVRITSGTAVVDGRTTVGSDLQVEDNALLVLNRSTLVAPLFSTLGNAQVRMTEPRDSLIVQAGSFGGGSTNGLLTDGVLVVNANFTQNGTPESFAASGNHTTVFAGLGNNQQAFFTNPGEGAGTSHFANVEMSKGEPGTHVQLDSRAFALGSLRTGVGAPLQELFVPVTEPRNGSVLFQSRGADVDQIRFSNVIWSILDGAPLGRMDSISFFASDSAATRLNMERSSDNVTLNGIDFGQAAPFTGGNYIRLVDTDGATGGAFTVNVNGAFPAARDDRYIVLVGGALLNWP